jgi:4-hydroxybenzoate polyprenyltransferase
LAGIGCAALLLVVDEDYGDYWQPVVLAAILSVLILLYDAWLKHTVLGPIAMGGCRFCNVLLGLVAAAADLHAWWTYALPGVVGLYVIGITWFARDEAGISKRLGLIRGAVTILAAILFGAIVPWSYHIWFRSWQETSERATPERLMSYLPLLALFAVGVGWSLERAIQKPIPALVQAAVKRCLLGIIVLDAILASLFVGWPGLLILLLLPPALILGKWVYST